MIELRRSLAIPIVLVTHDLEEAALLADRMTVLHRGRTLQTAAPDTMLAQPASALVARLTDQPNLFEGKVLQHLPATDTTLIEWLGRPLAASHQPAFAVGETVSWLVPEAAVVLVREHQSKRENTVSARGDGRREATLHFAIGAAVAQRRGIIPAARAAAVAEVGDPPAGSRCGDRRAGGDNRQGAIHLSGAVSGQGLPLPTTSGHRQQSRMGVTRPA